MNTNYDACVKLINFAVNCFEQKVNEDFCRVRIGDMGSNPTVSVTPFTKTNNVGWTICVSLPEKTPILYSVDIPKDNIQEEHIDFMTHIIHTYIKNKLGEYWMVLPKLDNQQQKRLTEMAKEIAQNESQ